MSSEVKIVLYPTQAGPSAERATVGLTRQARLNGMSLVVGLPGAQDGDMPTTGAAYVTRKLIYPDMLGRDIGCGMTLFDTGLRATDDLGTLASSAFRPLTRRWGADIDTWLKRFGLKAGNFDQDLGTLGGGNHFAEFLKIDKIGNRDTVLSCGIDPDALLLLVHSGSRKHGKAVSDRFLSPHRAAPIDEHSEEALEYLELHNRAVRWALANREAVAHRIADIVGGTVTRLIDCCHNEIKRGESVGAPGWIHRRGVVHADKAPVIVAGNRDGFSYLVVGAKGAHKYADSIPHGAPRRWPPSQTRDRLKEKYTTDDMLRTKLGGRIICKDMDQLYEESPQAYYSTTDLVRDLTEHGVVKVVAKLRPVLNYRCKEVADAI